MKQRLFIFMAFVSVLIGCESESGLEKSIYVYDTRDAGLPEYSEWGYNTFGAYYDREIFIANDERIPGKIVVINDTISFILSGSKGVKRYNTYWDEYYFDETNYMSVTFKIAGFSTSQYSGLVALNDTTFELTSPDCHLSMSIDTTKYIIEVASGQLNFKRVQFLHVDDKPVEAILSGYFNFKATINGEFITVSDGRFDVGISDYNFYIGN
jgi:hypothetical protein